MVEPMPRHISRLADVDLRLLKVFRSVARCGGLAAAESELGIGRSTISRYVKTLEIRLGTTLCMRGRSGFFLTEDGSGVLDATERLLGAIGQFCTEVNEISSNVSGALRVSLFDKTITNPHAHVAEALGLIAERAPDSSIELLVRPNQEIEAAVADGTCQIGIMPTYRGSPAFEYAPLFNETMYLYCGYRHPLFAKRGALDTERQIRDQRYAGLNFHSPNMQNGNRLGLVRRAKASDQEAIATLILSGRYIGFLPTHYAASFVADHLMRPLLPSRFQYTCHFAAIVRRTPPPSRLVNVALNCLRQVHARTR